MITEKHIKTMPATEVLNRGSLMFFSRLSLLSSSASADDKVFAAIEDITGRVVVSVVSEANKYCFKDFHGKIHTIDMDFVNGYAGI